MGSNEVHQPSGHRSMSKRNIRRTIQNGGRGLIQYSSSGLLDEASLLILALRVAVLRARHIEPLGSAGLIASKIVALAKNRLQYRVIGIDTGVDERHNTRAADSESILCILKPDNLGRGLGCITMPDHGAVIAHGRRVIEPIRNVLQTRLWQGQDMVRFNAHDSQ